MNALRLQYSVNKAGKTDADVMIHRLKQGQCGTCGTQTHAVKVFGRKTPLNNRCVENGRCLACHPAMPPDEQEVNYAERRRQSMSRGHKDDEDTDEDTDEDEDEDKYEGSEDSDGLPHGSGVMVYANGVYDGKWKHGKQHGYGVFVYYDGDLYEGEFKNDKFHGYGSFVFTDGHVDAGTWKKDVLVTPDRDEEDDSDENSSDGSGSDEEDSSDSDDGSEEEDSDSGGSSDAT